MKKLFYLLGIVTCACSARAIIIEDTPERLVFDITWATGPWRSHDYVGISGGGTGGEGSEVYILGYISRNPFLYFVDIHRVINGVHEAPTGFLFAFSTTVDAGDNFIPPPGDIVFGGPNSPFHLTQTTFPIPGNDHGVRFIYGQPYDGTPPWLVASVPDTGSTLGLLGLTCCGLLWWRRANSIKVPAP